MQILYLHKDNCYQQFGICMSISTYVHKDFSLNKTGILPFILLCILFHAKNIL